DLVTGVQTCALPICLCGEAVPSEPTVSADALLDQLRGRFEQLCQDVAAAVNRAPAGQVINASEEQVRDLLADFRQATYQAALQRSEERRVGKEGTPR